MLSISAEVWKRHPKAGSRMVSRLLKVTSRVLCKAHHCSVLITVVRFLLAFQEDLSIQTIWTSRRWQEGHLNERAFVILGRRLSGCFMLRVRQEEGSLQMTWGGQSQQS